MNRFSKMVRFGMERSGVTLRALCRQAGVDPSYLSKVLSGKRSPPAEEGAIRRLARALGLRHAELAVAAGRIPAEWTRLQEDQVLFETVDLMVAGGQGSPLRGASGTAVRRKRPREGGVRPPSPFSEELL